MKYSNWGFAKTNLYIKNIYFKQTYTHTNIYIYIYMYICVCVYVRVRVFICQIQCNSFDDRRQSSVKFTRQLGLVGFTSGSPPFSVFS